LATASIPRKGGDHHGVLEEELVVAELVPVTVHRLNVYRVLCDLRDLGVCTHLMSWERNSLSSMPFESPTPLVRDANVGLGRHVGD